MKKTLAALAVLGAFAGSAAAADVQLYGVVDEGFIYTNTKVTDQKSDNQFQLGSGLNLGSRWGLKPENRGIYTQSDSSKKSSR
ncbi:porin, partial [Sutterella wadsworthensis]|uniref:porin n=1 Tax=Sutterella wadsworthensis TaxID=40545 RepID=UPI003078E2AD